jgi:hypothetical protein
MTTPALLAGRRAFFVDEVDRHIDADELIVRDAQEIDVRQQRLVGMTLQIADNDLLAAVVADDQFQDG